MSRRRWFRWYVVGGVVLALAVLAGCGSAVSTGAPSAASGQSANASDGQSANAPAATAATGKASTPGPQYLIKALSVSMTFSDTRKIAADLQSWIATTDPRATSAGVTYRQLDSNN
jgi:hypothetical protein